MYPRQMNGPIISSFAQANENEFSNAEEIIDYLYNLSIDTANETELENIGRIVGYLRPLVPEGFNEENTLLLGTLPISQDEMNGLSTINSEVGGELSTLEQSDTYYMGLEIYRKFLKKMAVLKFRGITLASVAELAMIIDDNFDIQWSEEKDIIVHFSKNIGYKNIWILTQIFYKMALAPQILITSGTEEE